MLAVEPCQSRSTVATICRLAHLFTVSESVIINPFFLPPAVHLRMKVVFPLPVSHIPARRLTNPLTAAFHSLDCRRSPSPTPWWHPLRWLR